MNAALSSILALGLAWISLQANAAPSGCYQHDLKTCRFNNGIAMDEVECDALRKKFEREPEPAKCTVVEPREILVPIKRDDLAGCLWSDGSTIPAEQCVVMRRQAAERNAELAANSERIQRALDEAREAPDLKKEAAAKRAAEEARQVAALKAQRDREYAEERAEEARQNKITAARKATCGADYQAPRVGMSIERAKQCVSASLRVTGQVNRADGIVTTYTTGGGAFFHVMNGVIVAWGR